MCVCDVLVRVHQSVCTYERRKEEIDQGLRILFRIYRGTDGSRSFINLEFIFLWKSMQMISTRRGKRMIWSYPQRHIGKIRIHFFTRKQEHIQGKPVPSYSLPWGRLWTIRNTLTWQGYIYFIKLTVCLRKRLREAYISEQKWRKLVSDHLDNQSYT